MQTGSSGLALSGVVMGTDPPLTPGTPGLPAQALRHGAAFGTRQVTAEKPPQLRSRHQELAPRPAPAARPSVRMLPAMPTTKPAEPGKLTAGATSGPGIRPRDRARPNR